MLIESIFISLHLFLHILPSLHLSFSFSIMDGRFDIHVSILAVSLSKIVCNYARWIYKMKFHSDKWPISIRERQSWIRMWQKHHVVCITDTYACRLPRTSNNKTNFFLFSTRVLQRQFDVDSKSICCEMRTATHALLHSSLLFALPLSSDPTNNAKEEYNKLSAQWSFIDVGRFIGKNQIGNSTVREMRVFAIRAKSQIRTEKSEKRKENRATWLRMAMHR